MTQQKTISAKAWVWLAALGMIWGLSFVSIRIALDEIGPFTVVAHRTLWAMLVLWGVVLALRLRVPTDLRTWGAFGLMGLLNNAIPFTLMAWGQQYIESGLTSILNAATAVFGVLVAAMAFADERLSVQKAGGVLLGFVGVATAIGLENLATFDLRSRAQIAVLIGTISYALAGVWARKALTGLTMPMAAAGMLTASSLVMVPVAYWIEGPMDLALARQTILAIGYFAVIATAGAYLLYYRILNLAGSGNLSLVTLLVAPTAIVAGAVILGEQLRPNAYVGFALLALGLVIIDGRFVRIGRARSTPPPAN